MLKRKKVKTLAKQTAKEAAVIEHLIANGWEPGWISRKVLATVIRHEKKVRSRTCKAPLDGIQQKGSDP